MPAARRSEWAALLLLEDKLARQRKIEAYIDLGYGECSLRHREIAALVQQNLWHHDGVKYRLLAWCIMPNHVHVLVEIWHTPLGQILSSWKGYTAKQANKLLGRTGVFWGEDYFDHYIRDEEHLRRVTRYIENNPTKARLVRSPEEWDWSSARYRSKEDIPARTLMHPTASGLPRPCRARSGELPIGVGTARPQAGVSRILGCVGTGRPHSDGARGPHFTDLPRNGCGRSLSDPRGP